MPFITLPPAASAAIERLEANGFEAYVVGGCVRDSLLGRTPNDWDLTTNARPDDVLACFADCKTVATGLKHGTVTVLLMGDALEITTYRCDGAYADNRHPIQVTFSDSVQEDLARRDLTINAMAYHPRRGLCDPFGGQRDLTDGRIRCVGDPAVRFREDGLRILRAVRFAAVLGFSIAEPTAKEIHACCALLDRIAKERIRVEWDKLLTGPACAEILRQYPDIVAQILPEAAASFGFRQNSKYHHLDVWEHTLAALTEAKPELSVRLALFFHDLGKPAVYTEDARGGHFPCHAEVSVALARTAMERLRYDKSTAERVLTLVKLHDLPLSSERRAVRRLMTQLSAEDILYLLEVQRCDRLAHHPDYRALPDAWYAVPQVIEQLRAENACLSLHDLAINGNDLLQAGIPSGPLLGALLQALLNEVTEETLANERSALLAEAERLYASRKQTPQPTKSS